MSYIVLQHSGFKRRRKLFFGGGGGGGRMVDVPSPNSYELFQDLCEALLQRKTISVHRLARSFSTYRHTETLTSCYFYICEKNHK